MKVALWMRKTAFNKKHQHSLVQREIKAFLVNSIVIDCLSKTQSIELSKQKNKIRARYDTVIFMSRTNSNSWQPKFKKIVFYDSDSEPILLWIAWFSCRLQKKPSLSYREVSTKETIDFPPAFLQPFLRIVSAWDFPLQISRISENIPTTSINYRRCSDDKDMPMNADDYTSYCTVHQIGVQRKYKTSNTFAGRAGRLRPDSNAAPLMCRT